MNPTLEQYRAAELAVKKHWFPKQVEGEGDVIANIINAVAQLLADKHCSGCSGIDLPGAFYVGGKNASSTLSCRSGGSAHDPACEHSVEKQFSPKP